MMNTIRARSDASPESLLSQYTTASRTIVFLFGLIVSPVMRVFHSGHNTSRMKGKNLTEFQSFYALMVILFITSPQLLWLYLQF